MDYDKMKVAELKAECQKLGLCMCHVHVHVG